MDITSIRLAGAIALFFSAGALAQMAPAQGTDGAASSASGSLFDRLDTNQDGYLSAGELSSPQARAANWLAVDRDGDGRISRAEFTAFDNGGGIGLNEKSVATPRL